MKQESQVGKLNLSNIFELADAISDSEQEIAPPKLSSQYEEQDCRD